jgi:hypothetical protein
VLETVERDPLVRRVLIDDHELAAASQRTYVVASCPAR